jgi:hypothetical protein
VTTQATLAGPNLPLHWRVSPVERAEDLIFLFQNALDCSGRKHEKRVKFAQMEQAHDGIDVSGRKKDAGNWRVTL